MLKMPVSANWRTTPYCSTLAGRLCFGLPARKFGASRRKSSDASLALPVVAPGKPDHRSESCDSVHHCIFRGRRGPACDAAVNCHAYAGPPIVRTWAGVCPRHGAGWPTRSALRPICFPSPVPRLIIRRAAGAAQFHSLVSTRRRSAVGYGCIAAKRQGRTLLAFIAFQATDLLPAMRACHHTSAQSHGITRGLIRRR